MEIFGALIGLVFWSVVLVLWRARCRRTGADRLERNAGTALILVFPALGALSLASWIFVQEPLLEAARLGDVPRVRTLLARGASANVESNGGNTALGEAVRNGHVAVVRLLLERGADPNHPTGFPPQTPLALARNQGHRDVATLLHRSGARD
ncbi:MAG TPA: ankyrin repeat domain-containing protein [Armatimonadaceae bacterium]|jgi:hypothetical protein|nr:ankyrin repeat domain-containing protein [Armatimonadaceae bacterium]